MKILLIRVIDFYIGIPLCFICGALGKLLDLFKRSDFNSNPKKILLMKTWGMGNIVLLLPAMKAIREKYPGAQIYLFSLKRNEGILKNNPYINSYFLLDIERISTFFASVIENIKLLKAEEIDCILDFDQFARFTALFSLVIGIGKRRIGFNTKGQGKKIIFTDSIDYNNTQHMSKTFYDLAKAIGVTENEYKIVKVPYAKDDLFLVNNFLKTHEINIKKQILVGMHIGCGSNFTHRCWPFERFAQLADKLIEGFEAKIYFTGIKIETELIQKTLSIMKYSAIDISGKFTITQISALIEKSDVFFSSDTGPLHIASAMGTPVVGFFGPNTPLLYGPLGDNNVVYYKGLPCSPCITNYNAKTSYCKEPICIESIGVDEVYKEVTEKIIVNIRKI